MILILGLPDNDWHIQAVVEHLSSRRARFVCFSYQDFPRQSEVSFCVKSEEYKLQINGTAQKIDLRAVSSVWNRRTGPPVTHKELDKRFSKYVEGESSAMLENLYLLTREWASWLPSPIEEKIAGNKPYQLYLARDIGFKVPKTYIGTSERDFDKLFSEGTELALKKLSFPQIFTEFSYLQKAARAINSVINSSKKDNDIGNVHAVPTQRLDPSSFSAIKSQLKFCPVIIQEYYPKQFELRVTVVGSQVFACAIYSQEGSEEAKIDCRLDLLNLRHEAFDLPEKIEKKCLGLMRRLGLNFGCIDLIVTNQGEYVFLEVNPNGQWLWLERMAGLPISKAIANHLISHS